MDKSSIYEPVIGLEVHCELKTKTKLWCSCPNEFGHPPNSLICPVCLGLPGSLPVLNEQALLLAIKIGVALNCEVKSSIFHRKNYFYPDMPKNYQISQYDLPLNSNGYLVLPTGKRIGIVRAHIEEDTGKTIHSSATGRLDEQGETLVDYNRAGVPLVEIVSAPEISSADEARLYVEELRLILLTIGASDVKMEEGSLRVDANVSIRKPGDPFGTRCEIKNVNSLRSLNKAIEYEIQRQAELLESGQQVMQETRHYNELDGKTHLLRSKEEAHDYRYFPDPDLVLIEPDSSLIDSAKDSMPELPYVRREEIKKLIGSEISGGLNINLLIESNLDTLLKDVVALGADKKIAFNRISNEVMALYPDIQALDPKRLKKIVDLEANKVITASQAKTLIVEVAKTNQDPEVVIQKLNLGSLDEDQLIAVINNVLAENQDPWSRFIKGDEKPLKFLVGQVMKHTKGKADGQRVTEILVELKKKHLDV